MDFDKEVIISDHYLLDISDKKNNCMLFIVLVHECKHKIIVKHKYISHCELNSKPWMKRFGTTP